MRSSKRRKAFLKPNGALGHAFSPTASARETRAMLIHNIRVHRAHSLAPIHAATPSPQGELDLRISPSQVHGDNESAQLSLFPKQGITG